VVSFANATLVFEIGEEVKETSQSGFLATVATLHTQLLEDGSILQVGNCTACTAGRLWIGQPALDALEPLRAGLGALASCCGVLLVAFFDCCETSNPLA